MQNRADVATALANEEVDAEDRLDESGRYGHLSREALVATLERRDREATRLGLNWAADRVERDRALNDDFVTLRLNSEHSGGAAPWSNLVIEGDNFDALRWLRMVMRGRVKCIFVDPPYNTGKQDWSYNDSYRDPSDAFHDTTWLEFLHRRFHLARDLLADDGVMFVCINDEKRALLELMLNQTLPGMKVGSLVWRKRDTKNGAAHNLSEVHDHILIYAGAKFEFLGREISPDKYQRNDDDGKGQYGLQPITTNKSHVVRPRTYFPLQDLATGWWYPCDPDSVWRFATASRVKKGEKLRSKTLEELQADGRLHFSAKEFVQYGSMKSLLEAIDKRTVPKNGNGVPLLRRDLPDLDFWIGKKIAIGRPSQKVYWEEVSTNTKPLSSWIASSDAEASDEKCIVLHSDRQKAGRKEIKKLFDADVFSNPKPVSLVKGLVWASTSKNDTVVDFFAGSGTTAQAVMELNDEDGLDRRFVMVSNDEATETDRDRNIARDVLAERLHRLNIRAGSSTEADEAPFAYLRTALIPADQLLDARLPGERAEEGSTTGELCPEDVWLAVQAAHGLPLTPYVAQRPVQIAEGELAAVAFCDEVTNETIQALKVLASARKGIHAYAWTPGPVRRALENADAEVYGLPGVLWRAFKS